MGEKCGYARICERGSIECDPYVWQVRLHDKNDLDALDLTTPMHTGRESWSCPHEPSRSQPLHLLPVDSSPSASSGFNPSTSFRRLQESVLSGIGVSVSLASVGTDSRPVITAIVPRGPADLDGTLQEGDYLVRCRANITETLTMFPNQN